MKFQFANLADFIAMNGHGSYVWAAYLITLVALVILVWLPIQQQRAFFQRQRRQQQRAGQQPQADLPSNPNLSQ